MSSHDRGRDFRRRKYNSNKDRDRDRDDKTMKRPVILAKPKDESSAKQDPPVQPMIIMKNKDNENRALSPSRAKKAEDSVPNYQIAAKTAPPDIASLVLKPPAMKGSVKLLNENASHIVDDVLKYLTEQTDFLVIGCLGLQGTGKSTLMSNLAQVPHSLPSESHVFRVQSKDQEDSGFHCTEGIDAFITPERVILLDCQPVLSHSLVAKNIQHESSRGGSNRDEPEYQFIENEMEVQSLQCAAFLMSVCHIILVVQDWVFDADLLRFLQAAELLKPPTFISSDEEELIEYYPHVMLIHTKTVPSFFSRNKFEMLQETYRKIFASSNLEAQSGMGIANGNVVRTLSPALCNGDPLNIFMLPSMKTDESNKLDYRGHLGYLDLLKKLRQQLFGLSITPLTHTVLSERNWWHYCVKVWEGIKKSVYFPEYLRHLPTTASLKAELNQV